MTGWAIDPALGRSGGPVHLYVGGTGAAITADLPRPDVGAAFGLGDDHGFSYTMAGVPAGNHSVCAYAFRPSGSVQLGCRPIAIGSNPVGSVDLATGGTRGIRVSGWALDRSTVDSIDVHAYVDGVGALGRRAEAGRADIAAAFPGYGAAHGYTFDVPATPGTHSICLYAIDKVAPGANEQLGCRTVTVASTPFGSLDQVARSGSNVSLSGWTLDLMSAGPTAVHIYVDGVGRAIGQTGTRRDDVTAAYPQYLTSGAGFNVLIPVTDGAHQVCAYAVGQTSNSLLSCRGV